MEKMREVLAGTDRKPEEIVQKALSVIADGLWSVAEVAVLHQLGVKGGAGPLFGHPERLPTASQPAPQRPRQASWGRPDEGGGDDQEEIHRLKLLRHPSSASAADRASSRCRLCRVNQSHRSAGHPRVNRAFSPHASSADHLQRRRELRSARPGHVRGLPLLLAKNRVGRARRSASRALVMRRTSRLGRRPEADQWVLSVCFRKLIGCL